MSNHSPTFLPQLRPALVTELATARALCVAVALISKRGVAALREHIPSDTPIEVLVGLDLPTKPAALAQLLAWSQAKSGVAVRVWTRDAGAGYFHPKAYLIEQAAGWVAFVGSANCTDGGWEDNEELTARVEGAAAEELRREWFAPRFALGVPLTAEFIAAYSAAFEGRAAAEKAARKAAREANRRWQEWLEQQRLAAEAAKAAAATNLGRPVQPGQFFREEHYAAFDGAKPRDRTAAANRERHTVYDRMTQLHQELEPRVLATGWDLHAHYVPKNVVSSWAHGDYTEDAIRAMWLNYGRSEPDIKLYDDDLTPMSFIRLEAIIFVDHFATWCRIGRDGAIDREAFKEKMREPTNREAYFALIQSLGNRYFIEVRGNKRAVNTFKNADALSDFVRGDRQNHYFVIGKNYEPNDPEISEVNLAETVMRDWAKLYLVYQWMKRREV